MPVGHVYANVCFADRVWTEDTDDFPYIVHVSSLFSLSVLDICAANIAGTGEHLSRSTETFADIEA